MQQVFQIRSLKFMKYYKKYECRHQSMSRGPQVKIQFLSIHNYHNNLYSVIAYVSRNACNQSTKTITLPLRFYEVIHIVLIHGHKIETNISWYILSQQCNYYWRKLQSCGYRKILLCISTINMVHLICPLIVILWYTLMNILVVLVDIYDID